MATNPSITPHSEPASAAAPAAPRPRFDYGIAAQAVAVPVPVDGSKPSVETLLLGTAFFGAAFAEFYWNNLKELTATWWTDAGWSHGFAIPLLSIYLIRLHRDDLARMKIQGAWVGLVILLLGTMGQVVFRATGTSHMSNLSMIVILTGATLWVFGWEYLRILWLPISYLVFAINPPSTLYQKLTEPMQRIAADIGTRALPLFGITGERHGTTIQIFYNGDSSEIGVAEACSGMRMLVAFMALAVVLAYSTSRPMWQKVFLAVCSLPVAIVCNALRVSVTGFLVARYGPAWANGDAHGFVGLGMLIPAMGMQIVLGWVLDRMFVDVPDEPGPVAAGGAA